MKLFFAAHDILLDIIEKEMSFSIALHKTLNSDKYKTLIKKDVASLVGCCLRHYYVFKHKCEEQYQELINDQFIYLSLALANSLFLEIEDSEKVNKELEKVSGLKGFNSFIKGVKTDNLIPIDIAKDSLEYLSLRYNTPLWLLKMWKKHYKDDDLIIRLLKSNNKPVSKFYFAKDEYQFDNNFVESKIPGVYKLVGKEGFQKDGLIPITPAYKYILEKMDIDPLRGLLVYSEVNSTIINALYPYINRFTSFDLIAGNQKAFFSAKQDKTNLHLDNLNIYECPSSAILTVASKPVHTLIVLPENSQFSLLRNRPDYFLSIKQENMDSFITNEQSVLDNAVDFVEEGGQLLYVIETISKKEGYINIRSFVEKHPEFTILEQKQFLPCNSLESALYFAILTKGENR